MEGRAIARPDVALVHDDNAERAMNTTALCMRRSKMAAAMTVSPKTLLQLPGQASVGGDDGGVAFVVAGVDDLEER